MIDARKIGMHLLDSDLKETILSHGKIYHLNYETVNNNLNPDDAEYCIVIDDGHEGEFYYWDSNLIRWLPIFAIDKTKYTNDEIDALLASLIEPVTEYEEFHQIAESMESTRVSNENTRIENENTREANESSRQSSFSDMENYISGVENAESIRNSNELDRISNEDMRISNEELRNQRDSVYADNEIARNEAEKARSLFEPYNSSKSYVVGNKVSYNGSSYVCIKNATNKLPTDTVYWLLMSKAGEVTMEQFEELKDELRGKQDYGLITSVISGYDDYGALR